MEFKQYCSVFSEQDCVGTYSALKETEQLTMNRFYHEVLLENDEEGDQSTGFKHMVWKDEDYRVRSARNQVVSVSSMHLLMPYICLGMQRRPNRAIDISSDSDSDSE